MKKLTVFLLAVLFLLCGCAKEAEPENPYRLKSYTCESTHGDSTHTICCTYEYDEQGYLHQWSTVRDGALLNTEIFQRDEYGNILQTTVIDENGSGHVKEHTLTLDEAHRVLREQIFEDGVCTTIKEYAYDDSGNQTMLNIIRSPGNEDSITSWMDMTYDRE